MLLSVIVPVYNVENYLRRCIESILIQTFTDFEVILINDGSTDSSGVICDEYSKIDQRVKIIHKENGGLSDARNIGILKAKGEYISFIDSDDFIIENAFKKLIDKLQQSDADIIVANARTYISDNYNWPKMKKRCIEDKVYNGEEFLNLSIQRNEMSMCVPFNVYRRTLLVDGNLFFEKGILHEDELWTPQVFLEARKVVYLDLDFYMHYRREGSITQTKEKTNNGIDLIKTCHKLSNRYDLIHDSSTREVLKDYLVMLYLNAFYIGKLYKKEYSNLIDNEFLKMNASSKKNKQKVKLFLLSKHMYYTINYLTKKSKLIIRGDG